MWKSKYDLGPSFWGLMCLFQLNLHFNHYKHIQQYVQIFRISQIHLSFFGKQKEITKCNNNQYVTANTPCIMIDFTFLHFFLMVKVDHYEGRSPQTSQWPIILNESLGITSWLDSILLIFKAEEISKHTIIRYSQSAIGPHIW